jgi:hypothetical protein
MQCSFMDRFSQHGPAPRNARQRMSNPIKHGENGWTPGPHRQQTRRANGDRSQPVTSSHRLMRCDSHSCGRTRWREGSHIKSPRPVTVMNGTLTLAMRGASHSRIAPNRHSYACAKDCGVDRISNDIGSHARRLTPTRDLRSGGHRRARKHPMPVTRE